MRNQVIIKKGIPPILIFLFISLSNISFAQSVWDGGGDGVNWDDPLNWDTDLEPTGADDVTIPTGFNVVIRMAGELANDIDIETNSTLAVDAGASVTTSGGGDNIYIDNSATLTNNGDIFIEGSCSDCIDLGGTGATLTNNGLIDITNTNSLSDNTIETTTDCVITNNGTILIDDNGDASFDNTIDIQNNAIFINNGTLDIELGDDGEIAIFLDDAGGTFENFGTVTIRESDEEGIETDAGTNFINHASGVINIIGSDFENIELEGDFRNDGEINITSDTGSSNGICVGTTSTMTNNGVINLGGVMNTTDFLEVFGTLINRNIINVTGTSSGPAIQVNDDGIMTNSVCGIINAGTQFVDIADATASITNEGIFTSAFVGTHNNSGTFTNDGQVHSTAAVFDLAPNAISGGGTILDNPIPATTTDLCVPTMGEWGLTILTLLLLNGALLFVRRRKKEVAFAQCFID